MAMKEVPCHVCDGKGFITICTENSIGCKGCDACYGTGMEMVPVENIDRLRRQGYEDLATTIHAVSLGWSPWCDHHCDNKGDDGCDNCIKNWLAQPTEEDSNG